MLRKAAILPILLGGLASPAWATGSLMCKGTGEDGTVVATNLAIGHLPVLKILDATLSVGDQNWSTAPDRMAGIPFIVGQAFGDDRQILVDFTDDNVEGIVASIRLMVASAGEYPTAGVLTVAGKGAWAIVCSEG